MATIEQILPTMRRAVPQIYMYNDVALEIWITRCDLSRNKLCGKPLITSPRWTKRNQTFQPLPVERQDALWQDFCHLPAGEEDEGQACIGTAYTGVNRHASDTRIGLMESSVPIEALFVAKDR